MKLTIYYVRDGHRISDFEAEEYVLSCVWGAKVHNNPAPEIRVSNEIAVLAARTLFKEGRLDVVQDLIVIWAGGASQINADGRFITCSPDTVLDDMLARIL